MVGGGEVDEGAGGVGDLPNPLVEAGLARGGLLAGNLLGEVLVEGHSLGLKSLTQSRSLFLVLKGLFLAVNVEGERGVFQEVPVVYLPVELLVLDPPSHPRVQRGNESFTFSRRLGSERPESRNARNELVADLGHEAIERGVVIEGALVGL